LILKLQQLRFLKQQSYIYKTADLAKVSLPGDALKKVFITIKIQSCKVLDFIVFSSFLLFFVFAMAFCAEIVHPKQKPVAKVNDAELRAWREKKELKDILSLLKEKLALESKRHSTDEYFWDRWMEEKLEQYFKGDQNAETKKQIFEYIDTYVAAITKLYR